MSKKQGFAVIPKAEHLKSSSQGGKAKVPKGYSKLSAEQRSENARRASKIRWERERTRRQQELTANG